MRYYYSSAGVLLRQRKYIVLAMRIYFSGNLNLLLLQCQFITVQNLRCNGLYHPVIL